MTDKRSNPYELGRSSRSGTPSRSTGVTGMGLREKRSYGEPGGWDLVFDRDPVDRTTTRRNRGRTHRTEVVLEFPRSNTKDEVTLVDP